MIEVVCIEALTVSEIKVEEKGKSASIKNPDRVSYNRVKVDGCVSGAGPKADWVIERADVAVIIELKGRNVEHAADQIYATALRWRDQEERCSKLAGLIVGRQTPAASTAMQIKKKKFSQRFGGPLHVVSANCGYQMDHVLSFKGPFRA